MRDPGPGERATLRIALGADHAGVDLKDRIAEDLRRAGHDILDLGTHGTAPVDYPDYARAVGEAVARGEAQRGILVCGSGVGTSVAANKLPGIRAAVCHDIFSARQGVEDDDVNVLCLGGRVIGPELARELVHAFLAARFSGAERHRRRLDKVLALEAEGRSGPRHPLPPRGASRRTGPRRRPRPPR